MTTLSGCNTPSICTVLLYFLNLMLKDIRPRFWSFWYHMKLETCRQDWLVGSVKVHAILCVSWRKMLKLRVWYFVDFRRSFRVPVINIFCHHRSLRSLLKRFTPNSCFQYSCYSWKIYHTLIEMFSPGVSSLSENCKIYPFAGTLFRTLISVSWHRWSLAPFWINNCKCLSLRL